MNRKKNSLIYGILACLILAVLITLIFAKILHKASQENSVGVSQSQTSSSSMITHKTSEKSTPSSVNIQKSPEAKKAVMDADYETMQAYGLYYDYANMNLVDTVKAYMTAFGIDSTSIAFSYKNTRTGETASMNDTQPMTAGSTYKLPLNMLVVDAVTAGQLSLTEKFDITNTPYELLSEHDAYVAQFNGAMTIPDMQEYSLVYSENTPAYALADRLGGMSQAYDMFEKYGQSRGEVKTIQKDGNKTTSDYYIQVLDYLWNHQEKYADIIEFMEESFPGDYYKRYLPNLRIVQKPGYVRDALNVDAMVFEDTPYLISIYTAGLGGSTEEDDEINGYGYTLLTQLTYVINEWHRVNGN